MADFCDQAEELEQLQREQAIKRSKENVVVKIFGDGTCIECGNTVDAQPYKGQMVFSRWCSDECREIWVENQ